MKKILIIIGAIILSIPSSGQTIKGWFYARDYYSLDGTEVTGWSGGYLPDTNKVNLLILGALDTTVAAVDTIYISGQDEWVGNNDTIYKVDSAGISDTALFALNATADSIFVSVTGTDTVKGPLIFNETDIEIKSNSGDINLNGGNLGVANLGTDKENGTFYTGSVEPTNVFALNYDGIFRATGFKSDTSYSDTLTAVKIKADTIEFVGGYIANLYDQSIEIYATDYDASIIVGGEVEGIALETNGTITFTAVSTVIPALSSTGIVTESLSADTITADTITSIKTKTDTISMGNVVLTADEDTIKALNFWARFKGVIASVFRGDTIILGDSVITGTITLKAAVEAEQFDRVDIDTIPGLVVDGSLTVDGRFIHEPYEAAGYVPGDSILTTSVSSTWAYVDNSKFVIIEQNGFSFDGDTMYFDQDAADLRDTVEHDISWSTSSSVSNNGVLVSYGIFTKRVGETVYTEFEPATRSNRLATSGQTYSWGCTPMPIYFEDGEKIQIQAKTESTSTTLTTEDFGAYIKEE